MRIPALATLLFAALAAAAPVADDASAELARDVAELDARALSADESTLLNLHNSLRRQYGAAPLTWDNNLASFARSYAAKCVFKHSGQRGQGENLAAGGGAGYDAARLFKMWADEAPQYNYNNPVFTSGAGHFTQVVWKGTTKLGCALVDCADGTIFKGWKSRYLVCEYAAPGNVQGQFTQNVGRKQ
ncbi:hypothetical protein Q8F55_008138 [Vanrija albida]|uniref:SCP domain-containing protein n=1 Tax=Vanrija albida TaxID=181172 RepID=A0ABR3PVE5_9TREE